ncbi:MAG: hypothetical protein AAB278_06300 [Pseudomonadota bacterium]
MEMTLTQKFWVVMTFLAIGPPVGSLVFAPMFLFGAFINIDPVGTALGFIVIFLFSYLFGLLPAGLVGMFFMLGTARLFSVDKKMTNNQAILLGAASGLIAAMIFFVVLEMMTTAFAYEGWKKSIYFDLILGLVAGGVCGRLVLRVLNNPESCPQISKERIGQWAISIGFIALFFGAAALMQN